MPTDHSKFLKVPKFFKRYGQRLCVLAGGTLWIYICFFVDLLPLRCSKSTVVT